MARSVFASPRDAQYANANLVDPAVDVDVDVDIDVDVVVVVVVVVGAAVVGVLVDAA